MSFVMTVKLHYEWQGDMCYTVPNSANILVRYLLNSVKTGQMSTEFSGMKGR